MLRILPLVEIIFYIPENFQKVPIMGYNYVNLVYVFFGERARAMPAIQCDLCSNPAKEKCATCGFVYCVRHIQRTGDVYTCDICIKAPARTRMSAADYRAPKRAGGRSMARVGCSMMVGCFLILFLAIIVDLSGGVPLGVVEFGVIGGALLFWIGVVVWIVGLVRRRKA